MVKNTDLTIKKSALDFFLIGMASKLMPLTMVSIICRAS